MSEVLLVRHAQSYANKRDFTAFGNIESPLTEKGIEQALKLNGILRSEFGIIPEEYSTAVLASEYTRPQQTARYAGFNTIDISGLVNESAVEDELMSGIDVIKKHYLERWSPEESRPRAKELLRQLQSGDFPYGIVFTHGMFIANTVLECDAQGIEHDIVFDDTHNTLSRGYVPLQASVTRLVI